MMVIGSVGIVSLGIAVPLHHIYQADPREGQQGTVNRVKGYIGVCFSHLFINRFRVGVVAGLQQFPVYNGALWCNPEIVHPAYFFKL